MNWHNSSKIKVATVLAALAGVSYGFAPLFGLDQAHQMVLEAVALVATVMMGVMSGIALEINQISKIQRRYLRGMVYYLLMGGIVIVAGVYPTAQHIDAAEFGIDGAIFKAATLVILIVIGAILGTKYGIQKGVFSIGDTASTSRNVRNTKRINDVALRKALQEDANTSSIWRCTFARHMLLIMGMIVGVVGVVAVVAVVAIMLMTQPTVQTSEVVDVETEPSSISYAKTEAVQMERGMLFTAATSILGFAVFGSALTIRIRRKPKNKDLVWRAGVLIPIFILLLILVQALFMLPLAKGDDIYSAWQFNYSIVEWWIFLTAAFSTMVALFVTLANSRPASNDTSAGQHSFIPPYL